MLDIVMGMSAIRSFQGPGRGLTILRKSVRPRSATNVGEAAEDMSQFAASFFRIARLLE